ncbi:reverse transcriptase domain-containing protein [Tanacetum coccineum]
MHTRASNSELVEPLLEPERTLNRRRRRRNKRVPFDQRNNPSKNPRIVYLPILDINHFRHFLVTLENLYPIDDEPIWDADCVVTPTPGSAITILETANEFAIKGNALKLSWSQSVQRQHYQNLTQEVLNAAAEGHNSKAYQLPQSHNEHVNAVFTRSGKSYNPPVNSNDQQTNSENPINFDDSDEEDKEPTPQPKIQNPKPVKETTLPKPYKPKIPYPQRLRKEKMEAQYGKFLDVIRAVRINVPLIDVLAGMPNYGKFLKELISNKHKIKQIFAAFLSDESSAMIENKVPPKLGNPGSFLIRCNFNKTFSCNALANLGASINLIPYSLYAKLSLKNLNPTKMSVRLADRSFQYPVGIVENMLVKVGKFTFLADFVILEMKEDSKVPLILGRPFLHTADAVIQVKQNNSTLDIDVIEEILEEDFDALLDEGSKILHSIEGTLLEEPPMDLELKPLPDNLEYVFLVEPSFFLLSYHLSYPKKRKTNSYKSLKSTSKPLLGKQ